MWGPQRLTTLCAFTACYRDSFTIFFYAIGFAIFSAKSGLSFFLFTNSSTFGFILESQILRSGAISRLFLFSFPPFDAIFENSVSHKRMRRRRVSADELYVFMKLLPLSTNTFLVYQFLPSKVTFLI
jgi:hypothetical protein